MGDCLTLSVQLPLPSPLPHLSGIQSRILLVVFQSGQQFVSNEDVMKSGVGHSAWSEEQKKLIELRLLEKRSLRVIRGRSVCKTVSYKLTDKGRAVAFNLSCISKMISSPEMSEKLNLRTLSRVELENEIIESIEVALDSFGINLLPLVKGIIEDEGSRRWKEVIHDSQQLITTLRGLFGQSGASTIESMVVDNLKSRFDFESKENDLNNLISELKQKNSAGQLSQTVFEV